MLPECVPGCHSTLAKRMTPSPKPCRFFYNNSITSVYLAVASSTATSTHTCIHLVASAHARHRVFVFEPQPWKSYRNARGTTPTIDAHFASISLRPSTFLEYLTTEVGFVRQETLGTSTAAEGATFGAGKGAQRGIYALFK